MIHPSAALGGGKRAADPQARSNSNFSLSQLAASADVQVFGTARRLFGHFCYAASKDTNTICLPALT
jgi:hypothetical protein